MARYFLHMFCFVDQPHGALVEVVSSAAVSAVIDSLRRLKAARALSVLGQASWRGLPICFMLNIGLALTDHFQSALNV